MLTEVRTHLQEAHHSMKLYYDKKHREVSYSPGDYVCLKLQHYRQLQHFPRRLCVVLDQIGHVACYLQLQTEAKIHNVFHVSQLKPFQGDSPLLHTPLPPLHEDRVLSTPFQVLKACHIQGDWEILVQWANANPSDTTWEPLSAFRLLYPSFELEDKLFLREEGDVMDTIASGVTSRHRN
ncbi:uncharacterized protein [Aristolochia californica]|uniref:uncharacterized protein n=1 Tax=Aristolochia californica TaxID=171875 RepID=UPI0035D5EE9D